jgi:hypothetical protein
MAYPYWVIGHTWQFVHGSITPMLDRQFLVFWKGIFALFVLVNAALLYFLFHQAGGAGWALFGLAVYVFNPAVIFDAGVWGETEAILTTALLVAAVGFVNGKPRLGWSSLIVATLLKQTALFALPIAAVYSIRTYGLRRTMTGASFGVLAGFCLVAPLILIGYSPATIYRSVLSQVLNFAAPTPVNASADTFSVWAFLNGFSGLHGFSRIWAPYPLHLGAVSFATAGTIAFAFVLAFVLWRVWRSDRPSDDVLFLSIAAVMAAYVTLSTLASARYLLIGLPFMILALRNSSSRTRLWMLGGVTLISFVSMYGVFMEIAVRGEWPNYFGLGNPSTNLISNVVYRLYNSDVVIYALAVLLVLIAESLLLMLYRASSRSLTVSRPALVAGDTSC